MHTANKLTPPALVELTELELNTVAGGLGLDGNDQIALNEFNGAFLEGGEGNDTVQVNGSNTDRDVILVSPNGNRVL